MLAIEEPVGNTPANILTVYPNPATDMVHVKLNDAHKAELTVFDITGRKLFTYTFNGLNHTTLEQHFNSLDSGVYVINAVSDAGCQSIKLVLAR